MSFTKFRPVGREGPATTAPRAPVGPTYSQLPGATLLSDVLARLSYPNSITLQFMPLDAAGSHEIVARNFAIAAASQFGRVLLLTTVPSKSGGFEAPSRRLARLLNMEQRSATPDARVPGLYHQLLGDADLSESLCRLADEDGFRLIAVQSLAPAVSLSSLSVAQKCQGTVLTVAAGRTCLSSLQVTARQVQQVGAQLLGTVLLNAPSLSPCSRRAR